MRMVYLRDYLKKAEKLKSQNKNRTPLDFSLALSDPDLNLHLGYKSLLPGKKKSYLSKIIETCYYVSMETDEGRPLIFNVVYRSHYGKDVKDFLHPDETPFRYVRFAQPRPFNQQELKKLSVCNPITSGIWIGLSQEIDNCENNQSQGIKLEIKGYVFLGEKWLGAIHSFSNEFSHNADPLVFRAEGPGWIDAYLGSKLTARLKSGRIFLSLPNWAANYNILNPLVKDGFESFVGKIYFSELEEPRDSLFFREAAYHMVLLAIVNAIQLLQHGGVLIIVSSQEVPQIDRLLKIKYRLHSEDQSLRELFLKYLNTRYLFIDAAGEFKKAPNEPGNKEKRDALFYKTILARRQLTECCQFIGGLASTDGAIVLDTGLNVLGFSSEILQSECSTFAVNKEILHVNGHLVELSSLQLAKPFNPVHYGMRHRSAIRLSLALKDSALFVISQDGYVNLLWDRSGKHYFWEDINTKNIHFDISRTLIPQSTSVFSQSLIDKMNSEREEK